MKNSLYSRQLYIASILSNYNNFFSYKPFCVFYYSNNQKEWIFFAIKETIRYYVNENYIEKI